MYNEDKTILQEIQASKNLRKTTLQTYQSALQQYTEYCQMSMTQLLKEADTVSLAIGREGQNVRLAARLTGYKIDIKAE